MPINQLKFIKFFADKYITEYPELPMDIIADIIISRMSVIWFLLRCIISTPRYRYTP
jgi:hypothetical protein